MSCFDARFESKLSSTLSAVFTGMMVNNSELRGVCITGAGITAQPGGTNSAWDKFSSARDTNDDRARKAAARHGELIDNAVHSLAVPPSVWPFLCVKVCMPYKGNAASATVRVIDAASAAFAFNQHKSRAEVIINVCD